MKLEVTKLDASTDGEIDLSDEVFALPVRRDLLARAVNWQLAKRRAGTHKVKSRGEITGTSKKAFRQKGTGHARRGNMKTNIMRGGGVVHGPVVRDHGHELTKKVRKLALKTALSAKAASGQLRILDAAQAETHKTKALASALDKLGWSSALILEGEATDENFSRAVRNIPGVDLLPQEGANVYDILRRDTLVLTKDALTALEARLK